MDWPLALVEMDAGAGAIRRADELLAGTEQTNDIRLQLLASRSCLLVAAELLDQLLEDDPDFRHASQGEPYPVSVEILRDAEGNPTGHRFVKTPGASEE